MANPQTENGSTKIADETVTAPSAKADG